MFVESKGTRMGRSSASATVPTRKRRLGKQRHRLWPHGAIVGAYLQRLGELLAADLCP